MSASDDLVSSTLYSLLNTLSHGAGSSIVGPGATSVRSHSVLRDGEVMTLKTGRSDGKKTEEQRRLVAVTAVEVVSRLALEIKRDDVSGRHSCLRCTR
jgi:phosphatidylinositol 4-kinase